MPSRSQPTQSKPITSIMKVMNLLGGIAAFIISVAIPGAYFIISKSRAEQTLFVEATFLAKSIEHIVQARPELWEFESIRLAELISQPPVHWNSEGRGIYTVTGKLVVKNSVAESPPVITASATFYDSGKMAGSIFLQHSILPELMTTAFLGIFSSLLGCLIFFVFRIFPIRTLKNTLIELQREKEKSEKTLYAIGDGVISVDSAGNILFLNRVAESLVGENASEALGRPLEEVYVLGSDQKIQRVEKEKKLAGKGGKSCVIEEIRTPLSENETTTGGFVIVFRDITERKRLAEELQKAHDELEQRVLERTEELRKTNVNLHAYITDYKRAVEENRLLEERLKRSEKMEALGTLAAGVAHDLNNVLGIVTGYSEILLMKGESVAPFCSQIGTIKAAARKAAAIVDDLLALARRGVPAKAKVLNLNKIIVDCQHSPELKRLLSFHSAVEIKSDLAPDLLNISGSAVHLGKALFNLVANAVEAIQGSGTVDIKTTQRYLEKPIPGYDRIQEGEYVILSVSDTGIGIPGPDQKRVFEPFYTKKILGRSGTGLGLAVVWGTVKDHLGYCELQSEEGKGTTFTLYFPGTRDGLTQEPHIVPVSDYMGKGESILVVDDVKEQRHLAENLLNSLNYKVASLSSGEEAIAYLKDHTVDLLVLDMIMDPGMDGLDTLKGVLEIRPGQKSLIASGYAESDRVKTAQALGSGTYLKKPYLREQLGLAVRKELDRSP